MPLASHKSVTEMSTDTANASGFTQVCQWKLTQPMPVVSHKSVSEKSTDTANASGFMQACHWKVNWHSQCQWFLTSLSLTSQLTQPMPVALHKSVIEKSTDSQCQWLHTISLSLKSQLTANASGFTQAYHWKVNWQPVPVASRKSVTKVHHWRVSLQTKMKS